MFELVGQGIIHGASGTVNQDGMEMNDLTANAEPPLMSGVISGSFCLLEKHFSRCFAVGQKMTTENKDKWSR